MTCNQPLGSTLSGWGLFCTNDIDLCASVPACFCFDDADILPLALHIFDEAVEVCPWKTLRTHRPTGFKTRLPTASAL